MPATTLFFFFFLLLGCATAQSNCSTFTCGGIAISYPFRLSSDPPNCGFPEAHFALDCHADRPFLKSGSGILYAVRAITYGNYSIRLADPGLIDRNYSSCPAIASADGSLYSDQYLSPHPLTYAMYVSYITCRTPVSNPAYVDDPACGNATAFANSSSSSASASAAAGRVYSYIGRNISPTELESACIVNNEVRASSSAPFPEGSYSYSAIHDLLSHGFEYSWYQIECGECERSDGRCSLEGNRVRCRHYCYEDTPLAERSFRCKLDYYAPFIVLIIIPAVIGGCLLLRFLLGMSFVIAIVVSRRKKQRAAEAQMGAESESLA